MEPPAFAVDAAGLWVFNRRRNFRTDESVAVDCFEDELWRGKPLKNEDWHCCPGGVLVLFVVADGLGAHFGLACRSKRMVRRWKTAMKCQRSSPARQIFEASVEE